MKCPECVKAGTPSNVYPGPSMTTAMWCPPYYDEEGRFHHHDMNTTTTTYKCSNGHEWSTSDRPKCWCESQVAE